MAKMLNMMSVKFSCILLMSKIAELADDIILKRLVLCICGSTKKEVLTSMPFWKSVSWNKCVLEKRVFSLRKCPVLSREKYSLFILRIKVIGGGLCT